jgi:hypothetical protein
VLFVSIRPDIGDAGARFDSVEKIADVDVAVYQNFHRKVSIWLLKGFKGY